MFKVRSFWLVVLATILVLLSACNSGDTGKKSTTNNTNSGEKIKITWWDANNNDATVDFLMNDIIAEYERKNPNVKIERTFVPFGDIKNKLLLGAVGDALPDITWIDNPDFHTFAAANILADLTEEISKWELSNQFYEGPWSSTVYDGKNYGVPIQSNNLALYYNVDMLSDAGIDPPKNWDELKEAAKKLTVDGVYGFAASGIKHEQTTFHFMPFVWQAGSDITMFDSEGTVRAIQLWADMVEDGSMSKEVITQDQQDIAIQFASGNIAMMVNGGFQLPYLKKEATVNWDVVPLPIDKHGATVLGGWNWAITKQSKHKDIAWDIIKFAEEAERKVGYLKAAGQYPSRKDIINQWEDDKYDKIFIDNMEVAKARAYGPDYPKISTAIQEMILEVLTGTKAADVAVKDASQKITPLLP